MKAGVATKKLSISQLRLSSPKRKQLFWGQLCIHIWILEREHFMSLTLFQCFYRRSHRRCSIQKAVLKNLAIFTGKHLCWKESLYNKVERVKLQQICCSTGVHITSLIKVVKLELENQNIAIQSKTFFRFLKNTRMINSYC